eukprot:COSAG01_NODE_4296_length_5164_cov_3.628701_1_plen_37_part_00
MLPAWLHSIWLPAGGCVALRLPAPALAHAANIHPTS